ncbi:MAG: 50S ribosomal protein L21 [Sideroxyarcus sp.]|nr:50S ribosomal protein L21 [Sideroxyarcus sp.]
MSIQEKAKDFSVIATGGKQYIVRAGATIAVEKLPEAEGAVSFEHVLLRAKDGVVTLGAPDIAGATVKGTILKTAKGKKVRVTHYKAKTRQHRSQGHRQIHATVHIDSL